MEAAVDLEPHLDEHVDVDEVVLVIAGRVAAAPEPAPEDDEPDLESPARNDFVEAHVASFQIPEVGYAVAQQRIRNIERQTAQCTDSSYRERAQAAFDKMVQDRAKALEAADKMHEIKTQMLTDSTVDDLVAPHNTLIAWPPLNTDRQKGFNDTKIPTLFVLQRFGMHRAREEGKEGFMDRHNDDRHSASKDKTSFPTPGKHGEIDWLQHGCSDDHDAAHLQFWEAWFEWRLRHVYGETTLCGIGHLKKSLHDKLVKLEALPHADRIPHVDIERLYLPHEKYAHLTSPVSADVTLYCSPSAGPEEIAEFPRTLRTTLDQGAAAERFTHLTSLIQHVSMPMYIEPSLAFEALGRVQQIEVTYGEVRFLLGIELEEEAHGRHLSRVYLGRCYGSSGFYIPGVVKNAYALLGENEDACEWGDEQVSNHVSKDDLGKLLFYRTSWRECGRTSIGQSINPAGMLEEAIAGWKAQLHAALAQQSYPVDLTVGSASPIVSPLISPGLGVDSQSHIVKAQAASMSTRLPIDVNPGSPSPILSPLMSVALGVETEPPLVKGNTASRRARFPVALDLDATSSVVSPFMSFGLGVDTGTIYNKCVDAHTSAYFPVPLDANSTSSIVSPVMSVGLSVDTVSQHDLAIAAGQRFSFPVVLDVGTSSPIVAPLMSPGLGVDGQAAGNRAAAASGGACYPASMPNSQSPIISATPTSSLALAVVSGGEHKGLHRAGELNRSAIASLDLLLNGTAAEIDKVSKAEWTRWGSEEMGWGSVVSSKADGIKHLRKCAAENRAPKFRKKRSQTAKSEISIDGLINGDEDGGMGWTVKQLRTFSASRGWPAHRGSSKTRTIVYPAMTQRRWSREEVYVREEPKFATNFVSLDSHTSFIRGEDLLTEFSQSKTIGSGGWMKQHFCKVCGTLMFRTGEVAPGVRIMRVGTVDDMMLAETTLAPRIEQYTKDKLSWIGPIDAEIKCEASMDFDAVLGKTDRWAPKAKA
ncbi:hypothetical protein JCM8208_007325 [Rhodotorula glutinis]